MKKISFITLFFCIFFPLQNVLSQEYYIKYGVNDCASCNYYMHQLSKELDGKKVSFLFPSRFENDSSLMVAQLGLAKFNHRLIFDDSMYKHFVKGEESYFIALSDGKMFKTKLKEFDLMGVRALLHANQSENRKSKDVCVVKKNSDDSYYMINDSTIISTSRTLNRVTYQDLSSSNIIEIIPDTSWARMAYQKYYGETRYREKYDKYLKLLIEAPTMMPTTIPYALNEDNILYIYASVMFWEYKDSLLDNVGVMPKMAMFTYDVSTKKLISCLIIPPAHESDRYHVSNIGKFIKSGDIFYFFIMEGIPTDSSKVLAKYKLKGNELIFDQILDFSIPNNYIRYKLGNNFKIPYSYDGVFSFQLSERIYDISTGKTIQIPIDEREHETLNGLLEYAFQVVKEGRAMDRKFYRLHCAADKGNGYGVLYTDKNNDLIEIIFDKEKGNILKKQKIEVKDIDPSSISVNYHPQNYNQIIYYNASNPDGCFHILDL